MPLLSSCEWIFSSRSSCLDLDQLLLGVGLDEFVDNHVSSSNSDYESAIEDLGIDLLGSEHVVSTSESLDGDGTVVHIEELGKHLINLIMLVSHILLFRCFFFLDGFGLLCRGVEVSNLLFKF